MTVWLSMGSCCSCQVSIVDKVHDVGYNECKTKDLESTCENGEGQVMLKGSSKCVSMYSQKGTKGVNQDGMTVWEVRNKILSAKFIFSFHVFLM